MAILGGSLAAAPEGPDPDVDMPTAEAVGALRADPRFPQAAAVVAAGLAQQYAGSWVLNRVLSDRGRAVMGLLILDLHYNGQAEGGLTASRLKQRCTAWRVCSPGRVTAMLGAMRLLGLVAEVPSPDQRVRRLAPTGKLVAIHRRRWRKFFEALALLLPEGREGLDRLDDDGFVAAQIAALRRMYDAGMRLVDYVPEFEPTFRRDAGALIVLALAVAARDGRRDPQAPLDLTISELAARYAVSRGHVLTVLRDLESGGLVRRVGARNEGIAVDARLLDAADRMIAAGLLIHAAAIRAAGRA